MKAVFLGTGTSQGIPVIACDCSICKSLDFRDKRLRTSIYIELDNSKNIVIDTGPDFRQQILDNNIKKVDAVLFTHEHKDHTAGLDDIRAFNFKYQFDMPIYARRNVIEQIKTEYAYIFNDTKYPGIPQVKIIDIGNDDFYIENQKIVPIEVLHYKLPVLGFRINNFTYITDANYIPAHELEKIKGTEILVLNALRKSKHISHFNLEEALELIQKIKPQKAYLTHISHLLGEHDVILKQLPKNVFLAYDGLSISC